MDRPNRTMYFLNIALAVAARSTCMRRKFGAVLVKENAIVGTGYNGTAMGVINCSEIGCIKNELNLPTNQAYDFCPAVHAEENAIINSNRIDRIGATLYISGIDSHGGYTFAIPCQRCKRKIINSQIEEVIILNEKGKAINFSVISWIKEDTDWYKRNLKEAQKKSYSSCS